MKVDKRYPQWQPPQENINIGDEYVYRVTREVFKVIEKKRDGFILKGRGKLYLYDWNREDFIRR